MFALGSPCKRKDLSVRRRVGEPPTGTVHFPFVVKTEVLGNYFNDIGSLVLEVLNAEKNPIAHGIVDLRSFVPGKEVPSPPPLLSTTRPQLQLQQRGYHCTVLLPHTHVSKR